MPLRMSESEARRAGLTIKGPKKKKKRRKATVIADLPYPMFERMCAEIGLPIPYREVQFCEGRQWRFDFAWHDPKALVQGPKVALEIEGGIWNSSHGKKSRHFTGVGATADMEKYNAAALDNWRVFRCSPQDIESGAVFTLLKRVLGEH